MNQRDLVDLVSIKTGLTKTDIQKVVDEAIDIIVSYVPHETIRLEPLGTFRITQRSARAGINPRTKEKVFIPAKITIGFKAIKTVNEKLK